MAFLADRSGPGSGVPYPRGRHCAPGVLTFTIKVMTGAHRRAGMDPTTLEGIRALLWLVGFLAVVGVFAYFLVTDWHDLPILTLVLQSLILATFAKELVLKVVRSRTPTPVALADWIGDLARLIGWIAVVISAIGQNLGWMHGAFKWALSCILVLFVVGMPLYWWKGQRRVVLALTARSVAGQWPWSVGG
jgi:hypothetical protein